MGKHSSDTQSKGRPRQENLPRRNPSSHDYSVGSSVKSDSEGSAAGFVAPPDGALYHPYPIPPLHLRPASFIPLETPETGVSSFGTLYKPAPSSFRPGDPTNEYNRSAASPSKRSNSPHEMLLVLDLNGTLLHRKRLARAGGHYSITPRPYLASFLDWVFDRRNKLKVMVWSSAKPENVNLIARKCFKRHFGSIYRIWARDTLGLTTEEYRKSASVFG